MHKSVRILKAAYDQGKSWPEALDLIRKALGYSFVTVLAEEELRKAWEEWQGGEGDQ